MAEEDEPQEAGEAPKGLIGKIKAWVGDPTRRNLIMGCGLGALALVTVAGWLVLAQVAAGPEIITIDVALRALDEGEDELAKALVTQIQEQGLLEPGEYGGPLFVLGALKVREAERQWSVERQINEYLIASKYLGEARSVGLPQERIAEGLFLLGKSLIGSRQLLAGVEVLESSLDEGSQSASDAYYLLAEAYFFAPKPRFNESIGQLKKAIESGKSTQSQLDNAHLLEAEAYVALNKETEAEAAISKVSEQAEDARTALVKGKVLMLKLKNLSVKSPDDQSINTLADQIASQLDKSRRLDKLSTNISRESDYLLAQQLEILGKKKKALVSYGELRRVHNTTPAGVAASIAEGDLLRKQGDTQGAVDSYRRALTALKDLSSYRSALKSLNDLRTELRAAYNGLVSNEEYAAALELNDFLFPLFSRTQQIELRANLLEKWGKQLMEDANDATSNITYSDARRRYREAGMAYEQLAEARFATRNFSNHLWSAIESHYLGQSYESVIRLINRYLRNEPQKRAALALLRLGQARMARSEITQAIEDLEECLEFYPTDASSYQARLECAKAYRLANDPENAEKLLRANLFKTSMTPTSPEWRDSLFELGRVFVESESYEEAIDVLEEAVDRYPDNDQSLEGRYLIANAHRHAADAPLKRLAETDHVSKKEEARAEANRHLIRAEEEYALIQNRLKVLASTDPTHRAMLRNCYVMRGEVLFEMGRYEEAVRTYSVAGALYQNEPFVLETLVQTSHCWRRLHDIVRSRGAIEQAKLFLTQLPPEANFATSTNLTRNEWADYLDELGDF